METRNTMFANIFYLIDDEENIVGIRIDPGKYYQKDYFVGDVVKVTDDGHGYISPGIETPGIGIITDVHEDDTDHFFTVKMENGETGLSVKWHRLEVIYDAGRREFFSTMLRNGDDIEKIRAAALDYFDDKISETMYMVDFAWDDELEIACLRQKNYKTKKAEVEQATTAAEIVAIIG